MGIHDWTNSFSSSPILWLVVVHCPRSVTRASVARADPQCVTSNSHRHQREKCCPPTQKMEHKKKLPEADRPFRAPCYTTASHAALIVYSIIRHWRDSTYNCQHRLTEETSELLGKATQESYQQKNSKLLYDATKWLHSPDKVWYWRETVLMAPTFTNARGTVESV